MERQPYQRNPADEKRIAAVVIYDEVERLNGDLKALYRAYVSGMIDDKTLEEAMQKAKVKLEHYRDAIND